jgi:hypothetical protein
MVSLSIMGMTGWVNPFCLAVRRPWTLSVARRGSAGAFFVENPAAFGHDTTAIGTHISKAIGASQGGGALAVALPPSHSETRKARHDGEASVPLPDDGLPAHVDEEQTVGLDGGTALETADASDTFSPQEPFSCPRRPKAWM